MQDLLALLGYGLGLCFTAALPYFFVERRWRWDALVSARACNRS